MTTLTGNEITRLGIVRDLPELDSAIQPAGVDVSAKAVHYFLTPGTVDPYYKFLADHAEQFGTIWHLKPGAYLIDLNETIAIPKDCVGYMHPRSTLLRCGVSLHTAVWDPGYTGKGQVLLVVHNPAGFTLSRNARIGQLTVHRLDEAVEGYDGSYQGEGI